MDACKHEGCWLLSLNRSLSISPIRRWAERFAPNVEREPVLFVDGVEIPDDNT